VPKVTRRRARSDLGDAKTRFFFRLVLKEGQSVKFLLKEEATREKLAKSYSKVVLDGLRAGK